MPDRYDLSIIIVSWNVKELLQKCISSIFEQTKNLKYEVIVIDNASHDNTVEMIKLEFPKINVIANKKNEGFAKANNQGISIAKGEHILLLNPDTVIIDKAIEKTISWMKVNKQAAIVGCKMTNPDGTIQPSVRRFPTIGAMCLILLKLHRLFPELKPLKNYYLVGFDYSKNQAVDQVMGAFFMIRHEVRQELPFLDQGYFIWFEEVDYCRRAKEAGFETWYFSGAKIMHYYGQSFRQVLSIRKQIRLNNSLLYYYKNNGTPLDYLMVLLLYPFSLIPSLIVSIFRQPVTNGKF